MRDSVTKSTLRYLGCVFALALIANCGSTTPSTEAPPTEGPTATPGPPAPPPSPPPPAASIAGTYTITANLTEGTTCTNFFQTFTGSLPVVSDASTVIFRVIERQTRTYTIPSASISAALSFNAGGANGDTLVGQVSGNQIRATETLNRTNANGTNCRALYAIVGNRP